MIPEHVLQAFDSSVPAGASPEPAGWIWDNGYLMGSVVFTEAADSAHFSATVRGKLDVPGVRLARPARSTDGRFVVGGWKATNHISGRPEARIDETVSAALRLAESLTDVTQPSLERTDIFAIAEREAWAWADEHFGALESPVHVGHADMLATTIYSGTLAPAVTDLVPFAAPRPQATTAALVIADAMIMEAEDAVDFGYLERFAHVPDLEELVLRSVIYREHVSARHPDQNSLTRSSIARVRSALVSRRSETI